MTIELLSTLQKLALSSAATVATVLRKNGVCSVSMKGPQPLRAGQLRLVGPAATLRFIPAREDISTPESAVGPRSARAAVELMPSGSVLVAAADGIATAGVFGDIVCARMQWLGLRGLITDGRVRDLSGIQRSEWPIWACGATPPPSTAGVYCADAQVPVGCGGVTVFPGDIIVADDDGVVVIPQQIADSVASQALEMERFEEWALREVKSGARLEGLYPADERTLGRYRLEVARDARGVATAPNAIENARPFASEALRRMKPSATITLTERAKDLKRRGREVIFLTVGEPDFDTPENVKQAAIEAIRRGETKYTATAGIAPLREAIAEKLRRENGLQCAPEQTIVSPGAKNVIFNAFAATLNAGDEAIVPAPYWVSYPDIVQFSGGVPIIVPTAAKDGYKLRPERLDAAITAKTKWLVLNSPCNPTGSVYSAHELREIADVLLRHPHVWTLSDDIYEHLIYDELKFATLAAVAPELGDRILTVNGVSKSYAMTGWRIGYAAGPAPLIRSMEKLQGQQTTGACSIAQWAAVEALRGSQAFIQRSRSAFAARRDSVMRLLGATDRIHCPAPAGAFYVFPSCAWAVGCTTRDGRRISDDETFAEALLEEGNVAVVPGSAFGSPGNFRLSYATSDDTLALACSRIVEFFSSLR